MAIVTKENIIFVEAEFPRVFKKKKKGGTTIYFIEKSSPEKLTTFLSSLHREELDKMIATECGVFWILQAIALNEINQGNIYINSEKTWGNDIEQILLEHFPRLEEVLTQLVKAKIFERSLYGKKTLSAEELAAEIWRFFRNYFGELAFDSIKAREKLTESDIVMVVGQQGVGKSVVTEFYQSKGYEVVAMSQIVKEVVEAWGLDPNQTIDKIVGGQIAKMYFGPDILVQLAVHYLISIGKTKIVIDGPRLIEEAQAVINLKGRLIGVIADNDLEKDRSIRFERIRDRAAKDLTRAGDVDKFHEREGIESNNIDKILKMVKTENIILNVGKQIEKLGEQLESIATA